MGDEGRRGIPAGQIADAYAAYAESYRGRNGDDGRLAKNLARWLDGDDGLPVWSDGPILSDALGCDGEPLDMEGLAKADGGRVTPSEIAVVKCVLESCAAELDGAWARH